MLRTTCKRMVSMVGASIMTLSLLSGCGGAKDNTEDSQVTNDIEETKEAVETPQVAGNEALDIFVNFTWYWTDRFEGIIPEEITRQTGVVLNPTRAVDAMQLGVMIASDDLPDLVYTDSLFDRLSDPNISYSWNELIEQYAPDFKVSELQKDIAKSYGTDGNYYTLTNAFSTQEDWREAKAGCPTLASLFYRDDILKELNIDEMKTLDDYVAALGKVKEAHPDMIPLVLEFTFMTDIFKTWLIPGWVPTSSGLMETENQEIIHYSSAPAYKDFLKFVNNLYVKEYIQADNFAFTDGSQAEELAKNNRAFSYSFCTGNANEFLTDGLNKNGFDGLWLQSQPLVKDVSYFTTGIGWAGVFITKNNKNPEKSIQLMKWMFSDEGQRVTQWGRDGIEYTLDGDGVPTFSDEWVKSRGDEADFYQRYNPAYYFGISGVVEGLGRASGITENGKSVMDTIRTNLRLVTLPSLVEPKGDSDEKLVLDQIVEFVKNQETKIILSNTEEEFEANYAEMTKKLDQIGIKDLEAKLTADATAIK